VREEEKRQNRGSRTVFGLIWPATGGAPFAAFADNQGNRRKVGRAEKWQPATQVGTRENSFVWPVIRFPFRQAGREVSSLISTTAFHRRTELKPKNYEIFTRVL